MATDPRSTGINPAAPRGARRTHSARALTLVEAVIAVVVVAVAVPPVILAMKDSATRMVSPIQADRARWLASEKLEDLIADRHSTTRGYTYVIDANYPAESSITGFPGFTRTVAITESGVTLSGAGTGYKRATVTVSWTDDRGVSRSLAVSTVVTDY